MPKLKKPTREAINYTDESGEVHEAYAIMEEAIDRWHHLLKRAKAKIWLIWALNWEADQDGQVCLGKSKKASDYDRELVRHDAAILLNKPMWEHQTEAQKLALLDHCLCQIVPVLDAENTGNGGFKEDANGAIQYRMVKPTLVEFHAVARRHGEWREEVKAFAACVQEGKQKVKESQNTIRFNGGPEIPLETFEAVVDRIDREGR